MNRNQERTSADGYCIQVLIVNGKVQTYLSQKSFYIENIGKGGFRFLSDINFELEKTAVKKYSEAIEALEGDVTYTSIRVDLEDILKQEQEHTHDLIQWLGRWKNAR